MLEASHSWSPSSTRQQGDASESFSPSHPVWVKGAWSRVGSSYLLHEK